MVPWLHALTRRFLYTPLRYKVLLANCATTALLGLAGAVCAIQHVQALPTDAHADLVIHVLIVGIAVSFAVNLSVMRLVLAPLNHLEAAIDGIGQGKQTAPVSSPVADEQLDRLAAGIRTLQDTLEEKTQRVRLLSEQVLYAQEVERQRIARELHDEAAQTLTTVLLYLKLLEKSCDPEEAQRLENLRKLITHALNDIRQIAVELHPRFLDKWGLEAALAQRVDELNADGSQSVTLHVAGNTAERLPRDLELTFYRVAQEALNNVAHHSHARRAQVALKREANCLTLEVQDDGIGFDPDDVRTGHTVGLGLVSMRERLDLVRGELAIESQPGSGTCIRARAPLSTIAPLTEISYEDTRSKSE